MELWVIRHEWHEESEEWAIWHFIGIDRAPASPLRIKLWVEIASVFLIAIGVAGELAIGIKISHVNGLIRGKAAELRSKNAGLRTASEQLVGILNTEVSENDSEVQRLKADNLALEAIIQPRTITVENQRKIVKSCGEFKNHVAVVESYGLDTEAFSTGSQIISVLQAMKIGVADARASKVATGNMETGIHVRTTDASEIVLASCLADKLDKIGKLTTVFNDPVPPLRGTMIGGGGQSFAASVPRITIMVGIKPLPLLTPNASTKISK
jgi:hypothetical protein